ncbi:hypothetical protein NDU88_001882 [Pleurodeles waltl]|uniref:Uncharacterized protein n=1 Tax=Pleurodeles waltl TaxID=8319 RepID=A0AAV7KTT3_PLEWA|nr:hypothetical protein NDU88_001882 [Pleurodeles waltl]
MQGGLLSPSEHLLVHQRQYRGSMAVLEILGLAPVTGDAGYGVPRDPLEGPSLPVALRRRDTSRESMTLWRLPPEEQEAEPDPASLAI